MKNIQVECHCERRSPNAVFIKRVASTKKLDASRNGKKAWSFNTNIQCLGK